MRNTYLLIALFFASGIAFSQDLYSHSNAANTADEENSIDGWSGPAEIESVDDDPLDGQYAIKIKSEDDGRHAEYSFAASVGNTYAVTIWARKVNGNPVFDNWQGLSGFETTNITGQGWNEYIFIVTAVTENPRIRVYASKNGQQEREVYIDAVSIYVYNSGGSGGGGTTDTLVYTSENANLPTVDWHARNMYAAGSVGIGTAPVNSYRLAVDGKIRAKEVIVESGWSDFVFDPAYDLPSVKEIKEHIAQYGHLKDIPSESEIAQNGVEIGEMNKLLLQKIEELTLYLIEAYDRIEKLEAKEVKPGMDQ